MISKNPRMSKCKIFSFIGNSQTNKILAYVQTLLLFFLIKKEEVFAQKQRFYN